MKNLILKTILLLFAIIFFNCENNDPEEQLPPITQTGENTFGCLINGEPFVVRNTSKQVAIYQQGQLQFGANGISIILGNPLEINTKYSLIGQASYYINPNPQLGCHYEFEDSYNGNVTFTKIDRTNYIISGTFEFSTKTNDCEDVQITQGRFDLKYIP